MNIVIVNYGMGNVGSILNMFSYLNIEASISNDSNEILNAKKIVLPGVGAFDNGMHNIKKQGLLNVLNEKVLQQKTPVLGICLGMQLMTICSEEGLSEGLGWINARTVSFKKEKNAELKIPHMGWNIVKKMNENSILTYLDYVSRFYFVHSFHVKCIDEPLAIGKTKYGSEFDSMVAHDNIYGCQFHPEKSHKSGMKLLQNFNKL
jgi:glutamine amidotransferase